MNELDAESAKRRLIQFARGFSVSKSLQLAAELGIADLINGAPKSCDELAQATSTHAPSLYRLLRALASIGIFAEDEQGRFANTSLSEPLRTDTEDSLRDHIMYIPHDGNMRAWMRLKDTLRTGRPTFKDANGLPLWEYLQNRPVLEQCFDRSMTHLSALQCEQIISQCDFSVFRSVVDIGGGQGLLLAKILHAFPQLRGVLVERDSVAERAKAYFQEEGIADRSSVVSGDFLRDIPAGHDAYLLKQVLHNWSDGQAQQILCRCREAMLPEHGRLFIFDTVIKPGNDPHPAKWVDLHMLVTLGGKERTAEEFAALLAGAGFAMQKAVPGRLIGIVEAVPT